MRLLVPLAQDLREWRLASGRSGATAPVICAADTRGAPRDGEWTEVGHEQWITRMWEPAL